MSITLTYAGEPLPLDDDLFWADEYNWTPVNQTVDPSLTGALIVQVDGDADRPGRPITLQPEDDFSAWMIRDDLDTLNAWAAIAGANFTLSLRGVDWPVIFRHESNAPGVVAKPVVHFSNPNGADYYLVTLKFLTV